MNKPMGITLIKSVLIIGMLLQSSCASSASDSVRVNKPPASTTVKSSQTPPVKTANVEKEVAEDERIHVGRYTNHGFGFSVLIPEGYKGIGSLPGTPQHGISIQLSKEDEASLSIDGDHNSLFLRSLDEVYKLELEDISENAKSVELLEKKNILLDKHPGIYFTVQYVDKETGKVRVISQVKSMRKCGGGESEVIYTLRLDTIETRAEEDSVLMKRILESWKMLDNCG
jgi:hypothetical protein